MINNPWTLATGGDLRFPEVAGKRRPADKVVNRYLDGFRIAASLDPVLGDAFLR